MGSLVSIRAKERNNEKRLVIAKEGKIKIARRRSELDKNFTTFAANMIHTVLSEYPS